MSIALKNPTAKGYNARRICTMETPMKSLGEFIIERQAEYPHAKGELSGILSAIRLAAKVLHRDINRAGLVNDILGDAGAQNVQGET